MKKVHENSENLFVENKKILLKGDIDKFTVPLLWKQLSQINDLTGIEIIDLKHVTSIDSAGSLFIEEIASTIKDQNNLDLPIDKLYQNVTKDINDTIKVFSQTDVKTYSRKRKDPFFVLVGDLVISFITSLHEIMILASDVFYWAILGIWRKKGARKGSFTQQSLLIGMEAVPIVALLSLIIGLILSLQAAVQLRMFGADIFIADMLGYAMLTEMGAMMTAIIVSGRSGSSIASEIATMKVSEELDALKMMSINPIRYVIVPKFYAMSVCMPLLVILSIIIGILGGVFVAILYLNISATAFYNQLLNVLTLKDLLITMIKSTFFGWSIVIIGSFYGLKVEGGAEGVGKATTYSVVTSIITVIIIDVIFSLLYLP